MKPKSGPLTLEGVEEQFAEWRRTRKKPTTPLRLKQLAVELLSGYRQSEVLKRLKISHAMLKRWRQELSGNVAESTKFVALPVAEADAGEARARLIVTHRGVGGETLSLEGELSEGQWCWAMSLLSQAVR